MANEGGAPKRVPATVETSSFDRFAEATSRFVSRGVFFTVCLVVVAAWMPTIFMFSSVDTWQLVINTMTSVLAFLLIALLQNSERRYDEALHHKVDALAAGLADVMQNEIEADRDLLQRHIDELRRSVGLEKRA
jgi:low affinity Fe/Cu permease